MIHDSESPSPGTYGVRLLKALAYEGLFLFSTEEARGTATRIGISENYISPLLGLLVRDGWLSRLHRGLFVRSGTAPGDLHVHPFAVATRLVTPSAVSHWSALNYHGLTEQVPTVVNAFTPKKVVTPSMRTRRGGLIQGRHGWEIQGIRYEYVSVKREHFFGNEEIWVDEYFKVPITDRERTILEVFISPRIFGGMGEGLGIVESHIHEIDTEKLVTYAIRYGKIAAVKRIGWALERAGVSESRLEPLLNMPATGYHALDPTRPHQGACDKRWMIQDNMGISKKT